MGTIAIIVFFISLIFSIAISSSISAELDSRAETRFWMASFLANMTIFLLLMICFVLEITGHMPYIPPNLACNASYAVGVVSVIAGLVAMGSRTLWAVFPVLQGITLGLILVDLADYLTGNL